MSDRNTEAVTIGAGEKVSVDLSFMPTAEGVRDDSVLTLGDGRELLARHRHPRRIVERKRRLADHRRDDGVAVFLAEFYDGDILREVSIHEGFGGVFCFLSVAAFVGGGV